MPNDLQPIPLDDFFGTGDDTSPSLLTLLPTRLRELALSIPPYVLELSEPELEQEVSKSQHLSAMRMLRIRFWEEYERAFKAPSGIVNVNSLTEGVCTPAFFYRRLAANPTYLAYILRPHADYQLEMANLHSLGFDACKKILSLPVEKNGRFNAKLAELQVKIFEIADKRVKGAIPQTIKNLNLNANVSEDTVKNATQPIPNDLQTINARIAELEAQSKRLQAPSAVQPDLIAAQTGIIRDDAALEAEIVSESK